jgi:protein TonB
MPTELLSTRTSEETAESVGRGFFVSVMGHLAVVAAIAGSVWLAHRLDPHWGEPDPTVGAIQATAVNSLPLPPKQLNKENAVLTSEKPSPAPTPPPPTPAPPTKAEPVKPKSEPPPKPNEVLIPKKTEPVKAPTKAPTEQPVAPRRVTPPPAPTPKATTGDTSGIQIPQSITQLKNGTASITVPDRAFGDRYAFYIRLIGQKIAESKSQELDPPEAAGKRATIHFIIQRDGTPVDAKVVTPSGSTALDTDTLRAILRIDTFGPLPSGNQLPVIYVWEAHPH